LFQLTRTGQGKPLTLVVSDGGTVRCNGGAPRPLSDPALLDARNLARDVSKDAKAHVRLPPNVITVFSYTLRTQEGTVSFADTAAPGHPELARVELFAVRTAREPCGLAG
jgi:hypothetical protein